MRRNRALEPLGRRAWRFCAAVWRRFENVTQVLEPECRMLGQTDNQVQFAADRFDGAAQGRQDHVCVFLDLGHGRLPAIQRGGDIELSLAGDPPQLAQTGLFSARFCQARVLSGGRSGLYRGDSSINS
jgi:hypothetical protein